MYSTARKVPRRIKNLRGNLHSIADSQWVISRIDLFMSAEPIIGGAGSFRGNHTWADGLGRCTVCAVEWAGRRQQMALDDFSTLAALRFRNRCTVKLESFEGIKFFKLVTQSKAASWNETESSPLGIFLSEDRIHQFPGLAVAFIRDDPGIAVIDPGLRVKDLSGEGNQTGENIRWFKSSHCTGQMVFFSQWFIGICSNNGTDMAGAEQAVDVKLGIRHQGNEWWRHDLATGENTKIIYFHHFFIVFSSHINCEIAVLAFWVWFLI